MVTRHGTAVRAFGVKGRRASRSPTGEGHCANARCVAGTHPSGVAKRVERPPIHTVERSLFALDLPVDRVEQRTQLRPARRRDRLDPRDSTLQMRAKVGMAFAILRADAVTMTVG